MGSTREDKEWDRPEMGSTRENKQWDHPEMGSTREDKEWDHHVWFMHSKLVNRFCAAFLLAPRRYVPSTKDLFLTKGCSQARGRYPVTGDPKGMATVLYELAKAGCIQSLALESWPCSSRLAHRAFFLRVKSRVASGQKRVGMFAETMATRLYCLEQPIAPSTRACMVWL